MGWHPLRPDWARRVVADAGVRPGDLVLDLGAGAVRVDVRRLHLPQEPFRVVASPPYGLSTAVVALLLGSSRMRGADLVLQRAAGCFGGRK